MKPAANETAARKKAEAISTTGSYPLISNKSEVAILPNPMAATTPINPPMIAITAT